MSSLWRAQAACFSVVDPELFFSGPAKEARKICAKCKVQIQCAEYAISQPDIKHGIWAGVQWWELPGKVSKKRRAYYAAQQALKDERGAY